MKTKTTRCKYPVKYYWDCNNPKHHHQTKVIAEECIDKAVRAGYAFAARKDQHMSRFARRKYVAVSALEGRSLASLARELGYSHMTMQKDFGRVMREVAKLDPVKEALPDHLYDSNGWRDYDISLTQMRVDRGFWLYILDVYWNEPKTFERIPYENHKHMGWITACILQGLQLNK